MLMNITQYPYDVMTMYGSMQLNDLGSFKECRKMDASDYALVSLNISHSPLTLFFASCLPKECQQDNQFMHNCEHYGTDDIFDNIHFRSKYLGTIAYTNFS